MVGANFFHLCPSIDDCYNDISCSKQREMIFLNLLLDSKESATFLQVDKHFEKLISSQVFDEKRVCKVGKPCLFTSCVGEPRVDRAESRELLKARAISHFLVTRLCAVKKLYEATLSDRPCRTTRQGIQRGANFCTTLLLFYHTSDCFNQQNLPKLQIAVYLFILN